MTAKITSLYFDDENISLLVNRGDRIKTWGKLKIKPGLIEGMVTTDEKSLATQIVSILKKYKIGTNKIAIGISARQSLTRHILLPMLPKNLLSEAIIREARRLLPLPPEDLYLSWQISPAPENRLDVFLVGLPRKSLVPLFNSLKLAGIKPAALVLKPMAIARLVKEPNAVIVDIQATEFDIVLMLRGMPNPMRTISFASPEMTWDEKTPIIMDEIERTLKFYESNNAHNPLPADLPLYMSGKITNQSELCQLITNKFGFKASILTPPTDHPTGFNPQLYLANIGLARQDTPIWGPGITLDILPEEHRIKTVKWTRVLPIPATLILAGVAVAMGVTVTGAAANIASARAQLDSTNQILQQKQTEKQTLKQDIKILEDNLKLTRTDLQNCLDIVTVLKRNAVQQTGDLQILLDESITGMSLKNITVTQNGVTAGGTGDSEAVVLSYARSLEESGRFTQTTVDNITSQETGGYTFKLILLR